MTNGTLFNLTRQSIVEDAHRMEYSLMEDHIAKNITDYQLWNMYGIIISIGMMWYVITKFIFNIFATVKLPLDMWSKIDIFCAFTNISCFIYLNTIPQEAILDIDKKVIFNIMMTLTVIATWMRLLGMAVVM